MTWQKFYSREYGVQYTEVALKCFGKEAGKLIPKALENHCFLPENGNEAYYCDLNEWKNFENDLIGMYASSHEKLDKFVKKFYELGNKYVDIAKEIGRKSKSGGKKNKKDNLDNTLADYENYLKAIIEYCTILWVGHVASEVFSKELIKLIDKYLQGKNDEIISDYSDILVKPSEKSTIIVLQEEVLRYRKEGKNLQGLFEKYKWMPCLDIHNKPWTREDFDKFAEDIKEKNEENKISFEEVVKELNISEEDKNTLLLGKRIGFVKDARDDFRRQGVYFSQPFFENIAKEIGIGLKDISYLTHKELIDFLKEGKKVGKEIVDKRKNGFLIYRKTNSTFVITNSIEEKLKEIGFSSEKPKEHETKGISACKGVVHGIAKIVRGVEDLGKIQHGDILIAVTTHPDYVSAMHKAKAIVTDEGGMLCHAAIVSREMKKPCIVGTGNATKLFKDGETVLVDAEKGVIKSK